MRHKKEGVGLGFDTIHKTERTEERLCLRSDNRNVDQKSFISGPKETF